MPSTSRSRQLRRNATDAEAELWRFLRTFSAKFRRQQPIGPYIVDFVCFSHKLIVECDGGQHAESAEDVARDQWLTKRGYRVLRFWNNEVLGNTDGVAQAIADGLSGHTPHPDPLPQGERE